MTIHNRKFFRRIQLLGVNYQLSTQMSEYKQNIFDILSPFTEQAELVLLVDNPLKAQIISVRKMSSTMQSILNLYARKQSGIVLFQILAGLLVETVTRIQHYCRVF